MDDKRTARFLSAEISLNELKKYNFREPRLSDKLLS